MYIEQGEWENMCRLIEQQQKEILELKRELQQIKESRQIKEFPHVKEFHRIEAGKKSEKTSRKKGRPPISSDLMGRAALLRDEDKTIREIAAELEVSVGSVSNMLKRMETYCRQYTKMTFMNRSVPCTDIYVDFRDEKVFIVNYTDDLLHRAFGCIENPTWQDFQDFIEERCFPRTRDKMKWILKDLDLPCYDPLLIIEKTQGRMDEDHQWIEIKNRESFCADIQE